MRYRNLFLSTCLLAFFLTAKGQLPTSVDNSLSPYFPPIVSQDGGSCAQAAGIHYLFTYEMNRQLSRPVTSRDEHIFSYKYIWNFLNGGEGEGGFSRDGLHLTRTAGCMTTEWFPDKYEWYYRWVSGYNAYLDAMHYRAREISTIDLKSPEGLQTCMEYMADKDDGLTGGGIVGFSISGLPWTAVTYDGPQETGYHHIITFHGSRGSHAMTLVGYDMTVEYDYDGDGSLADDEHGAFIVVNSWDTWWGSDGRAYIPFAAFLRDNETGGGLSESDSQALCVSTYYHTPTLVFGVDLEYTSRNDLSFELGVAEGANATQPDYRTIVYPTIFRNQGGDVPMQGNFDTGSSRIEVAFDYTSMQAAVDTMLAPCFFLTVVQTAIGKVGEGCVRTVSLHDYRNNDEVVSRTDLTADEGRISGRRTFAVPTRPWIRDVLGRWYRPAITTANSEGTSWLTRGIPYAVQTADGHHAALQVTSYDPASGKVELDITCYAN